MRLHAPPVRAGHGDALRISAVSPPVMEEGLHMKTLEELQEQHSEMLATAGDLGMSVPSDLKETFTDPVVGKTIVSNLDSLIREFRKAKKEEKTQGSGDVVETPTDARPAALASTRKKSSPKPKKKTTLSKKVEVEEQQQEKSTMAKKAAKKKAARSSARGGSRTKLDPTKKIVWKNGDEIPGREGSARYKRIAGVKSASGKTVETFLKSGKSGTLAWCVKNGLAKVA